MEIGQPGWMGSLRVAILYFSGVLLGSVGASCIQPNMFLVGASAGVYALITAHLGNFLYGIFMHCYVLFVVYMGVNPGSLESLN